MSDPSRDSRTPDSPNWARWGPDGLRIALRVQPGARKTAIVGEQGQRLKVSLHAPPVDGKANEELLQFLAQQLTLRRRHLRLLTGAASKEKTVLIDVDERGARLLVERLTPRRCDGAG